jgi:hypothetical protein
MPARRAAAVVLILTACAIPAVSAQGTDLSLSPYASFLAPTGRSPLAGLSLSLAGSPGFALRLNGRTALRNTSPGGAGHASIPPWGADIDAVFALSGAPFGPTAQAPPTVSWVAAWPEPTRPTCGPSPRTGVTFWDSPATQISGRSLRRLTLEDAAIRPAHGETPSGENEGASLLA